jgi:glyoxylase-like metal-dependent hydrolase (beta-lactamase superfamily II)
MRAIVVTILATLLSAASASAQAGLDTVQIRTVPVSGGVSMLVGSGGNIGVAIGADAVFLVDDQFAPLSEKIVAAVRSLTDRPIRFLVNTHWHGDHTGGNENFGKAGVVIVAHDNVRQRMSVEQFMARFNRRVPASPRGALPVITFPQMVTFHLNDDEIHVVHVPRAHTDGDALVHWVKANVIHMGDTFFNGGYPFIDLGSGGSINGLIEALNGALAYVNEGTRIIPGHGALAGKAELLAYRDVVVGARDAVQRLIAGGRSLEAVLGAKPTAQWDAQWGNGFIKPDDFVTTIYESLTKR